jgi:hypothetical protein
LGVAAARVANQFRSQAALQGRTFKDVLDEALRDWLKTSRRRGKIADR